MGESVLRLGEGCAGVANGDGHEFYLPPYRLERVDKGGVLGGLLLELLVASEVPTEADLDEDEVVGLSVADRRVRFRSVRDSSGVDEVGRCALSRREEGVLGLEGENPLRDAGRGLCAFLVVVRVDLGVPRVLEDICVSVAPCVGVWR